MSIRDDHEIPPCPLHGDAVGVERATKVAQPWVCSVCVLVFDGTTSEWEAMTSVRAALMDKAGTGAAQDEGEAG